MKKIIIMLLIGIVTIPAIQAQKVYTLSECRQMALGNNIKMRDAKLTIDQAQEQEKEAYSKYFMIIRNNTYVNICPYYHKILF